MRYQLFGEFDLTREQNKAEKKYLDLGTNTLNEFWAEVDELEEAYPGYPR